MSLMLSQMALAADMALDSFLALMIAAPLCCTVCGGATWTTLTHTLGRVHTSKDLDTK